MTESNKKWKDALLKTSLPLEYVVAGLLNDLGFGIQGEYHYLRPNESGLSTEFSVDIWAVNHLFRKNRRIWGAFNYLIECKYCHPGIKWLFSPHSSSDTEYLFEGSAIYTLDKLCTRQIFDKRPIWNLTKRFPLCFKGVELLQSDATAQNIERGRLQLRYGAPRLAIHLYETQMMIFHDDELHVEFICPVLVTTAQLFVLKKGLSLNDFRNVTALSQIATAVPAVILTNPYSHLFVDYADKIIRNLYKKSPSIKERLEQLDGLLKQKTGSNKDDPSAWASVWFDFDIREIAERILIVNFNEIETIHKLLKQAVIRSGRSLTQIGLLQNDISQMKTWVSECK
jgi:hypothetical protein